MEKTFIKKERRNQFMLNMEKLIKKMVHFIIIGIILFSILSVVGYFVMIMTSYMKPYSEMFSIKDIIWVLPAAILMFLIYNLSKYLQNKNEKLLLIIVLCLEFVISAVMIVSYNTQPCSDYKYIWDAAVNMARGTFTDGLDPSKYMYYYNWQLGITAFESLIIRIFGEHFIVLKILNACIIALMNYMIYILCKRKFDRKTAIFAYITAVLFMPWLLSIPQFTNHHIGILFLLISLYLIDIDKWYSWLLAGLSIALLNVLRPIGIIVILSAVCVAVYKLIQKRSLKTILNILVLIIAYMSLISAFNQVFISLGYTDMNISEARVPYFKFQKGLYGYRNPYNDLNNVGFDYDIYNDQMRDELVEHITEHKLGTIKFVVLKMVRYLGSGDEQFEMTYNQDEDVYTKYPFRALYAIGWFQYTAILIFALKGYRKYINRYSLDVYQIFFIGNTLVYLFVEAWCAYRFESYPMLIILAALGMGSIHKNDTVEKYDESK